MEFTAHTVEPASRFVVRACLLLQGLGIAEATVSSVMAAVVGLAGRRVVV